MLGLSISHITRNILLYLYATLITNKTIFDNLYVTELQFQFISTNDVRYVKLGIIGCFPSSSKIFNLLFLITTISSSTTRKYTIFSWAGTTSVCIISQWRSWSTCSAKCQPGRYQYRKRSVLNDTMCSDPLDKAHSCDQSPCQKCTITSENYIEDLECAPPSDSEFGFLFD